MGDPLYWIGENGGEPVGVGDTDDLPDPTRATVDDILASVQKHPQHGWRFYKGDDGQLCFDMEWMGVESPRRPQHLRKRTPVIIFGESEESS